MSIEYVQAPSVLAEPTLKVSCLASEPIKAGSVVYDVGFLFATEKEDPVPIVAVISASDLTRSARGVAIRDAAAWERVEIVVSAIVRVPAKQLQRLGMGG